MEIRGDNSHLTVLLLTRKIRVGLVRFVQEVYVLFYSKIKISSIIKKKLIFSTEKIKILYVFQFIQLR